MGNTAADFQIQKNTGYKYIFKFLDYRFNTHALKKIWKKKSRQEKEKFPILPYIKSFLSYQVCDAEIYLSYVLSNFARIFNFALHPRKQIQDKLNGKGNPVPKKQQVLIKPWISLGHLMLSSAKKDVLKTSSYLAGDDFNSWFSS